MDGKMMVRRFGGGLDIENQQGVVGLGAQGKTRNGEAFAHVKSTNE